MKNDRSKQGKEREQGKEEVQNEARRSSRALNERNSTEDYRQSVTGSRSLENGDEYRSTDLRDSPMMAHLLDALAAGTDIGEYGRLTFVMVARHFMEEDEMVELLRNQSGLDEKEIRAQILQVKERNYNPPKRERILLWQQRQDFQICPDTSSQNGCNVYRELQFPDEIYEQINDFWEERAESEE